MSEKNINREISGMIVKGVGGLYIVRPDDGSADIQCRARGIFRFENITPTVGDRVTVKYEAREKPPDIEPVFCDASKKETDGTGFFIDTISERKNCLIRPAVANLTHIFIVIPSAKPKPDLVTVDKLVSIADIRDIEPVIIVNKKDLDSEAAGQISEIYSSSGFRCILLSAATGEGCDELLSLFEELTKRETVVAAFAGASAAGKSTLMKRLFPSLDLKTGDVSRKTERGKHTTRHVELYSVMENGRCYIADTPGFSLLDFTRFNFMELSELPFAFREFRDCLGKCRYTKCTHTKEEGCAVLQKMSCGKIRKERHSNYVALYGEIKKKPEWKRKKEEAHHSP